MLGPRYPAPSRVREVLAAAEHYVEVAPTRAVAWQALGFQLMESGPLLAVPEALPRALSSFRRAVAIDSTVSGSLIGLTFAAAVQGDTGMARQALAAFRRLQRGTLSGADFEPAWFLAATTGDTAEQRRLVRRESLTPLVTGWPASDGSTILSLGVSQGVDVRQATPLLEHALAAAATESQRSGVRWSQSMIDVISGHPRPQADRPAAYPAYVELGGPVLGVLFSDGDSAGYDRAGMALLKGIGSCPAGGVLHPPLRGG